MGKFSKDNFMKALKDSGIEEIVDIAGDLFTIVDPTSSWIDVTKAIIDVTTGLETNNKGNKAAEEAMDKASDLVKDSKKKYDDIKNPYGSKGKPDHQAKVDELGKKAKEDNPDMDILQERKIQGHDSNRRPDVQVVDPKTGKTTKIYEAERKPNSSRNKKREAEYKRLNIPNETHKVGA